MFQVTQIQFTKKKEQNTNLFRKERDRGAWHMYDCQSIIVGKQVLSFQSIFKRTN